MLFSETKMTLYISTAVDYLWHHSINTLLPHKNLNIGTSKSMIKIWNYAVD